MLLLYFWSKKRKRDLTKEMLHKYFLKALYYAIPGAVAGYNFSIHLRHTLDRTQTVEHLKSVAVESITRMIMALMFTSFALDLLEEGVVVWEICFISAVSVFFTCVLLRLCYLRPLNVRKRAESRKKWRESINFTGENLLYGPDGGLIAKDGSHRSSNDYILYMGSPLTQDTNHAPISSEIMCFDPQSEGGMGFLLINGIVTNVQQNSQAGVLGVESGWRIKAIDGKKFTEKLFHSCVHGNDEFFITFEKVAKGKFQKREPRESLRALGLQASPGSNHVTFAE